MRRPLLVSIGLSTGLSAWTPVLAQVRAQTYGTVVASESGAPLAGAQVKAFSSARVVTTDRLGRFSIWIRHYPDTLVVAFIGRVPDTLSLATPSESPLRVVLSSAPLQLSDVTVTALGGSQDADVSSLGRWQLSSSEVRSVPPAVEPDVFRALSLVPAISFSTPLSARPIVRGYDGNQSSFRIDGYEVLNLYHIGRIFSGFPADAAQAVSVQTAPPRVADGGTLAGIVDVSGRGGTAQGTHGGAGVSLVSASGWVGGDARTRWFGAARVVHLSAVSALTTHSVPYDFQDFYGSATVAPDGRPRGRVTVFASRDHLLDRDDGSGMDWNNVLFGTRWRVLEAGSTTLSLSTSATRFAQDVEDIQARRSRLDLRNRFARLSGSTELGIQGAGSRLTLGLNGGWRLVANRVTPRSGGDFEPSDVTARRFELGSYGEWSRAIGRAALQLGIRLDMAGAVHAWQPRARFQVPLGSAIALAGGVGRTSMLYHLVSDPQSEPDIAFYDFWLSAGENGVPVPKVDHATIDLDGRSGSLSARLSLFASRAQGLAELRPVSEPTIPGTSQFRYGRGRTAGLEVQVGLQGDENRPSSLSLTYVLGRSERNWGDGWVRWSQDHRHLVRVLGQVKVSARWTLFSAFEAATGIPITPVDHVVFIKGAGPFAGDTTLGTPAYVYGRENSARSAGTARADFGASFAFRGPGRSRMTLGLSVINLGFGPVAPLTPTSPHLEPGIPGEPDIVRVRYERLFDLPAVPTLTLRAEF